MSLVCGVWPVDKNFNDDDDHGMMMPGIVIDIQGQRIHTTAVW